MRIITNKEEYFYDFFQQIHPFIPNEEIKIANDLDAFDKYELVHYLEVEDDTYTNFVTICEFVENENKVKKKIRQSTFCRQDILPIKTDKYIKRTCKLAIYSALSEFFNVKMPWGALTGVRPTKMALDYYNQCNDLIETKNSLVNDYFLQPNKAQLLVDIIKNQLPINIDDNFVDFYVHIPFCTTRCSYCTFLSSEIDKVKELVDPYIDTLIEEIKFAKSLIKAKKYTVKNIYIGGGTPTSLSATQLDKILNELHFATANEFTVEAGRPDTITKDKLEVLNNYKVNRISINPQTFNEQALKAIGRAHTAKQVISAYELARNYPFIINMDLIVGLPYDENLFPLSLEKAIALHPENITVHTLSFKTKSPLTQQGVFNVTDNSDKVAQNVDFAEHKLTMANYTPYYLYRQKNMVSNLENIGYCKPNTQCHFNINSMEDFSSIIACGANAISKRLFASENRIERAANVKDIISYINRIDEMLERKSVLFKD